MSGSDPSAATVDHARHRSEDPASVLERPLAATSLLDAIKDLRRDVDDTSFPLELDDVASARASRARLVDQLTEHLIPRLTELSAPAVVVLSGSTGAGKSTLVNSLVGAEVTAAGVLRPTTKRPVLVHNPADAELLAHHPVLAEVTVASDEAVPRGIALLDAPDLDSVLESNRETAHRLMEAADLWLFVTTAARYGDALPWRVLEDAVERSTTVAMVLNRVPTESLPTVRGDLLDRLRTHGLEGSPLFVVPDLGREVAMLPPAVIAPIRRWLAMLAGPDRARTVIARTLRGSLTALRSWVDELADAVQRQADAAGAIGATLDTAVAAPRERSRAHALSGVVADGAVRARWAQLTAVGGPLAGLLSASGAPRGSARKAAGRRAACAPLLDDLVRSAAATLVVAGERAEEALRAALGAPDAPAGASVVLAGTPVGSRGQDRDSAAEAAARAWVAQGTRTVTAALAAHPPVRGRQARRRAKALAVTGDGVLAPVALAAAGGLSEAADLLQALLGEAGTAAVASLRDELASLAAAQVDLERATFGAPLADPDLAADASSRLRLRLAVLKGLT
ncbi:GTPase [Cellulomonas sp. 73-92]|uniref:GTPase n=1 Tax=Cellulomonas sp. 73-92 TaxID=1895740 RepID=UPI0025BC9B1E|nr:GTPase [Cellulomonas sp. 73-92]